MQSSSARSRNSTLVGFSSASMILTSYFVGRGKYSIAGASACGAAAGFSRSARLDGFWGEPAAAKSAGGDSAALMIDTPTGASQPGWGSQPSVGIPSAMANMTPTANRLLRALRFAD